MLACVLQPGTPQLVCRGTSSRGRASAAVVGQNQRYMGFVREVLLESGQTVEGSIIARKEDLQSHRARDLTIAGNIRFIRRRDEFHAGS